MNLQRILSTNDPGDYSPTSDDRPTRRGERQTIRYVLVGPKGAVQFVYWRYTGDSADELGRILSTMTGNYPDDDGGLLTAVDLGFHARAPMAWQSEGEGRECEYVGRCWYDGSGLNAAPVLEALMREGPEAVWCALESYYLRTFETPDDEKTLNDVGLGQKLHALRPRRSDS